ncbi:hypothetical protein Y1Q_0020627 [Alligator mississippiensis]|uniref:RRM domain-containing protein n=1 Tax=Alligator mississippiensis TaxID=8496 RepID=A0A151P425_ALLMI|nr:hypothetical protein Y1Q_0020627 [Alligator mississippiensis]
MERAEDAVEAIQGLDNTEFQGKRMRVQLSTSRLRTVPGMGDKSGCYRGSSATHTWTGRGTLRFEPEVAWRAAPRPPPPPAVPPPAREALGFQ